MGNLAAAVDAAAAAAAAGKSGTRRAYSGRMAPHSVDGRTIYLPYRIPDAVSFAAAAAVVVVDSLLHLKVCSILLYYISLLATAAIQFDTLVISTTPSYFFVSVCGIVFIHFFLLFHGEHEFVVVVGPQN